MTGLGRGGGDQDGGYINSERGWRREGVPSGLRGAVRSGRGGSAYLRLQLAVAAHGGPTGRQPSLPHRHGSQLSGAPAFVALRLASPVHISSACGAGQKYFSSSNGGGGGVGIYRG